MIILPIFLLLAAGTALFYEPAPVSIKATNEQIIEANKLPIRETGPGETK